MKQATNAITEWAYADIDGFNTLIADIRTDFMDVLGGVDEYTEETNPHISIHPTYRTTPEGSERVRNTVPDLLGNTVRIDGFGFYPSRQEPMVVYLDVSVEGLGQVRERFAPNVEDVYSPVTAHLTLVKAGDSGDEDEYVAPDEGVHTALMDVVDEYSDEFPTETTVGDVTVEATG